MSLLASWLASPPPDAAIEIAADRVAAAVVTSRGDDLVVNAHAWELLPAGVVTPSLTGANVQDSAAAVRVLHRVVERLGTRPRRVALVIPDTSVKVSLLRFEKVPPRREDFEQLVRWQLRKAAPFAVEGASVTWSPAMELPGGGREFVVELAREEGVREYEELCNQVGVYAGLVDIATFSLLGLRAGAPGTDMDWLLVHMRPDYTSIAIVRGEAVILYRNRPEAGQEALPDLVHQTAMYYQDRLEGAGFKKVYLAGAGRSPGATEAASRGIQERLGLPVERLDSTGGAGFTDRITAARELTDILGPVIGLLRRTEVGARV